VPLGGEGAVHIASGPARERRWSALMSTIVPRTDRREEAHEHIAAASAMCREMDMRFHREKAEAQMQGRGAR